MNSFSCVITGHSPTRLPADQKVSAGAAYTAL